MAALAEGRPGFRSRSKAVVRSFFHTSAVFPSTLRAGRFKAFFSLIHNCLHHPKAAAQGLFRHESCRDRRPLSSRSSRRCPIQDSNGARGVAERLSCWGGGKREKERFNKAAAYKEQTIKQQPAESTASCQKIVLGTLC